MQGFGKGFDVIAYANSKRFDLIVVSYAPYLDRHLRHHEVVLDMVGNGVGQITRIVSHQQGFDPTLHALDQHLVISTVAHHVHQAHF